MEKKKDGKRKKIQIPPIKKLEYWFDSQITRGILRFIPFFILVAVLIAIMIAGLIIVFGFSDKEGAFSTLWNGFARVINSDVPMFDEAEKLGYLVMMSVIALIGLLFTGTLIGAITNAISEKLDDLKRGNSFVAESNHIIVLGFYPGEYTLLRQLFLAAAGKRDCIVVAENMPRDEMENLIAENLEIPKRVRLVCRTVDITDAASIEKCSVESCRAVVVSPTEDMRTLKAILAVATLIEKRGIRDLRVSAIFSRNRYRFPPSIATTDQLAALQMNDIISRMIAHSCTQTGLSVVFRELLDYEGSEFYAVRVPGTGGLRFEELSERLTGAAPLGLIHEGKTILNPGPDFVLQDTDGILVLSKEREAARLGPAQTEAPPPVSGGIRRAGTPTNVVVLGFNETLGVILRELPKNVRDIYLSGADIPAEEQAEFEEIASERDLILHYDQGDPHVQDELTELVRTAEHVIILGDHNLDDDEADMDVVFLLLNLWDIRYRLQLAFNITVELKKESSQKLIEFEDQVDYLVSFSVSSLVLAQIAESPELVDFFQEILSDEGNEIYLKKAPAMEMEGSHTVRSLRRMALGRGYVFLGYIDPQLNSRINPPLDETITLTDQDCVILLGED